MNNKSLETMSRLTHCITVIKMCIRDRALGNHAPKSTTLCARIARLGAPYAYPEGVFPTRRHVSSRDRHGRGPRGPLFFPGTPAWRTRREDFDLMVAELVTELIRRWPQVATIEFAVEDEDVPLDCASSSSPDWLVPDCPPLGEGEAQMSGVAVGLGASDEASP